MKVFDSLNAMWIRSLEAIATGIFFWLFVLGGPIFLFISIILLILPPTSLVTFLYLCWIWVFDRESEEFEDRRKEWFRDLTIWKYITNYFPVKLVKLPNVKLDPDLNYMFCGFPHGTISIGIMLTFIINVLGFKKLFPYHKPTMTTLPQHFRIPFYRWMTFSFGINSASAKSLNHILSKDGGNVVGLIVGGVEEIYYTKPGQYKLYLSKRKGFVKIALLNGTPLVPVITFGETDIFDQLSGKKIIMVQQWITKLLGFPALLLLGRGYFQTKFGLLPQRRPLHVVVGKPLDVQKTKSPTQDQIDQLHERFVNELIEMFESQKKHYIQNYENVHIEIA